MRALSTTEIVSVWEQGYDQTPVHRALLILAAANPGSSAELLANLSIGRRDARLLVLRELTFGKKIIGLANCPECDEKMELAFDSSAICPSEETETPGELDLQINGHEVRFRLPTSSDLLAVNSRDQLLARCLVDGGNHFLENEFQVVVEKMAAADPMADVQLAMSCSSCGHQWQAAFDIVAFFWREIAAAARSHLRDVHTLASAYGWSESEILALSPARRHFYLEMLNE